MKQIVLGNKPKSLVKTISLAACLAFTIISSPSWAEDSVDPWEGFNRGVFKFNDTVDRYTLKPIAKGYQWVTPEIVQTGVSNVFDNLGELQNFGNNVLQLNFRDAGIDTARFAFNSVFGIVGIFDVATKMGLERSDQDFGLTLAHWGVPSGPYLVIPFLGPSTVRDAPAKIPDYFMSIEPFPNDIPARNITWGMSIINTRAGLLHLDSLIVGDPYIFIRNAYLETREYKISGYVEDDF